METHNRQQALDQRFRSVTTFLQALRRFQTSQASRQSPPEKPKSHFRILNSLCNVLVRTGTEVVAAAAALHIKELSLVFSSGSLEEVDGDCRLLIAANSKRK